MLPPLKPELERLGWQGGRGRDGGRGFRGRGGRFDGGGRGGFRDEGPHEQVIEVSSFVHACEGDAVTKLTNEKIPYFNVPIYLQNKTQIGKVYEIFGPINGSMHMEGPHHQAHHQAADLKLEEEKISKTI